MTFQHRARVVAGLAAVSALALAGCGGSPKNADVTVTVTPTVTAKAAPAKKTPAPTATSDVKGRAFDYGTVTKVGTVAGTTVIELDRWTWKGLDDAKLAQQGVPTKPFRGKVPYENQNDKLTYSIPVVDGARILVHHCIAATVGAPARPSTRRPSQCRPGTQIGRPPGGLKKPGRIRLSRRALLERTAHKSLFLSVSGFSSTLPSQARRGVSPVVQSA